MLISAYDQRSPQCVSEFWCWRRCDHLVSVLACDARVGCGCTYRLLQQQQSPLDAGLAPSPPSALPAGAIPVLLAFIVM